MCWISYAIIIVSRERERARAAIHSKLTLQSGQGTVCFPQIAPLVAGSVVYLPITQGPSAKFVHSKNFRNLACRLTLMSLFRFITPVPKQGQYILYVDLLGQTLVYQRLTRCTSCSCRVTILPIDRRCKTLNSKGFSKIESCHITVPKSKSGTTFILLHEDEKLVAYFL